MENAADALKIGFAVFIFIFALTLAFSTITQAKETADMVLFANDKTNYYDYNEDINATLEGRIVNIDTVISTIYRCKNETIVVKLVNGSDEIIFDSTQDKGELDRRIKRFVEKNINQENTYLEQFVEAKYSGKEITENDGSSIVIAKGSSKMYIQYTGDFIRNCTKKSIINL